MVNSSFETTLWHLSGFVGMILPHPLRGLRPVYPINLSDKKEMR
ncbi:hypothetical protein HMPREF9120_00361 [Neisseria sp. oral taxon 020 str. F0370]|nr:hypothetical protein HMPREF9120_00361 [Neisseria sp. oral taxon 020 str. F0370]